MVVPACLAMAVDILLLQYRDILCDVLLIDCLTMAVDIVLLHYRDILCDFWLIDLLLSYGCGCSVVALQRYIV